MSLYPSALRADLEDPWVTMIEGFEALIENLDEVIALHMAIGSDSKTLASAEHAKERACRAAALAREQLGRSPH